MQFVQYEDFEEIGIRELASAVLGEVPDQFVEYMVMVKDLNGAGKDLYKGKKTYHELMTGAKKTEQLEACQLVKSKTTVGSGNPLSMGRKAKTLLESDDEELDGAG